MKKKKTTKVEEERREKMEKSRINIWRDEQPGEIT